MLEEPWPVDVERAAQRGDRSLRATLAEAWRRMRHHLLLKTVGITVFMWAFFAAYFEVLRSPPSEPVTMPLTAIDHAVGFWAPALWPYLTLWFYVTLPPGLLTDRRDLVIFGLWIGSVCVIGLACFHLWPTAVPPQAIDMARHPEYALLQGVDAPGNAFPSLHVATATFTAIWLHRLLDGMPAPAWLRVANVAWFAAIAWSTLATKQHVFMDLLAGLVLGAAIGLLSIRRQLYSQPSPRRPGAQAPPRSNR